MSRRWWPIALAALWLSASVTAAWAADGDGDLREQWRAAAGKYESHLRSEHVVGASAVLMHDGAIIGESEYGFQDAATRRPVDLDTIYHWASNTKTLTGIAIMQLRDRGLLELDDPVTKYLPAFEAVHNPFGSPDDITIRHLLTHSSGLRAPTWPWGGDEPWHPFEPTEWSQLVAMFPYTKIEFEPGSKFSYSNPGITLLGQIVEVISGEDIEVYLDKRILKPLGMHRSYFDLTPWHLRAHRSHNYFVDEDGELDEQPTEFDTGVTVANGGLNAPMSDMIKYANFLLGIKDNGNYDFVLSRDSLAEMLTPQLLISETDDRRISIGLMFFISEIKGADGSVVDMWFGHTGSQSAFLSSMKYNPQRKLALLIARNTTGPEGSNTAADILREAVETWPVPLQRTSPTSDSR